MLARFATPWSGRGREFTSDEVALELRWTCADAANRMVLAESLGERLPTTLAAVEAGEIDMPRVRAIAEATMKLSDDHARQVEARVRAAIKLDPDGVERHRHRCTGSGAPQLAVDEREHVLGAGVRRGPVPPRAPRPPLRLPRASTARPATGSSGRCATVIWRQGRKRRLQRVEVPERRIRRGLLREHLGQQVARQAAPRGIVKDRRRRQAQAGGRAQSIPELDGRDRVESQLLERTARLHRIRGLVPQDDSHLCEHQFQHPARSLVRREMAQLLPQCRRAAAGVITSRFPRGLHGPPSCWDPSNSFISIYYRLNVLFTAFAQDSRYRVDVLKMLQGDVYDGQEAKALTARKETEAAIEQPQSPVAPPHLGTLRAPTAAPNF